MRLIWIRAATISWSPLLRWRIVSGPSKTCVPVRTPHSLIPLFLALAPHGLTERVFEPRLGWPSAIGRIEPLAAVVIICSALLPTASNTIVLFAGRVPVQPPNGNEGGDASKQEQTRQQRSLDGPLHETREIVDHIGDEREC